MWLFGVATGMLGWSPETAWHTPVPEILVAMKGKAEWTRLSNPFGAPEPDPEPEPEDVGASLLQTFRARGVNKERSNGTTR